MEQDDEGGLYGKKKVCKLTKARYDMKKKECLENRERVYALGQLGGRA